MADFKEKTYVEDVDRSVYDIRDEEHDAYRMESGLTPEIVEKLSQEKNDPAWMQQFRLESLQIYNEMKLPNWGPSIEGLDMDHIATYVRPNTKMRNDWKDVPEDIKETFERLGIPQAERKSLAGVGAQYDSELVYHNVKDSVAAEGVVYTDMESALKGEYADMVRKYFMKLVTPHDHKFAALHGAVWSAAPLCTCPRASTCPSLCNPTSVSTPRARDSSSISSSSWTRAPVCTLSRAAPPPSTTWPTSTPAVWSCM
jgi:Fe-S cluster assembly protein SufB